MSKENKNLILGMISIVIGTILAIFLLKTLFGALQMLLKTQSGSVIVTALITGFVALFTLFYNKRKELQQKREQYLYEERMKAYAKFYDLFFRFMEIEGSNLKKPRPEEMLELKKQLMMWASGETISAFQKSIMQVDENSSSNESMYKMESFLLQMRKDLGNNTAKYGELIPIIINNSDDIDKYRNYVSTRK
ncbi:hypothetical protein ACQUED_08240 [Lactococcus lactis]|uniref:hypothetical protein n=1 Tax=Lactococcus lactis TaxID=1358 RepID=UPI003D12388A